QYAKLIILGILSSVLNDVSERDLLILAGDFNCTGYNDHLLTDLVEAFNLCIPQRQKFQHLAKVTTWKPPGKPESAGNCIDLVITRKQQVNMIEKMQITKPRFITTDHKLVTARIGLHLNHNYLGKKPGKFQASWLEDASTRPRLLESVEQEMTKLLKEKRDDIVKSDLDTAWQTFKNSLLSSSHSSRSNAGYGERSNNLKPGARPSRARVRQERRSAFRRAVGDIKNSSLHNQRSIWTILRRELDVKGCKTAIPEHLRAKDFATYMQKLYSAESVAASHSDKD
ncbi:hypothetical protein FOZ62_014432, partial [Perkinsus olseni]